jgi:hypothetical protein
MEDRIAAAIETRATALDPNAEKNSGEQSAANVNSHWR